MAPFRTIAVDYPGQGRRASQSGAALLSPLVSKRRLASPDYAALLAFAAGFLGLADFR